MSEVQMDEVHVAAERMLVPYKDEVVATFGEDPTKSPHYRAFIQEIVVRARNIRVALDDRRYLRR